MATNTKCNRPSAELAMAKMPKQKWCEPYELEKALTEGTIFPCLNLPFFKAPEGETTLQCHCDTKNKTQQAREKLMCRITTVSFAINDLTLYLDTHPTCKKGLAMYHELMEERLTLLADYANQFTPLTAASAITGQCPADTYGWGEGPAPWEGGCI